jgi:hypothetical protein
MTKIDGFGNRRGRGELEQIKWFLVVVLQCMKKYQACRGINI